MTLDKVQDGTAPPAVQETVPAVDQTTPAVDLNTSTPAAKDANASIVSVDSTNGEHDPHFEPIVSLPEVVTKTLEEDQFEVFKARCKLFRFASNKEEGGEWKERGTGDVKLLRHNEMGTVRVLMRQEKTLKVRANHYVTPLMRLRPNCGSDRAFVWHVMCDFSDEETRGEMFAIKFANPQIALMFRGAFEEAVKYVTTSIMQEHGVMEAVSAVIQARKDGITEEDEETDSSEEEESTDDADAGTTADCTVKADEQAAVADKEEVQVTENLAKLSVAQETKKEPESA